VTADRLTLNPDFSLTSSVRRTPLSDSCLAGHGRDHRQRPVPQGRLVHHVLPDFALDQALTPSVFEVRANTAVALSLPKVDVREKFELSKTLERMGVGTMFSPRADLTGLSPDPLFVSDVIHEAVLRIDEQGLEGAAATAVVMSRGFRPARPAEPIVVHVDRPFLLAVRHARSGAIYFLAQVARP
jgi:serpin B